MHEIIRKLRKKKHLTQQQLADHRRKKKHTRKRERAISRQQRDTL